MTTRDVYDDTTPCATCGRPHGNGYTPMHPFRLPGTPVILEPPKADPTADVKPAHGFPFDPVLRQALIDKGVLTVDDLRDAEAKIVAVTGQFMEEVRRDGSTNPVGWGRVRSDAPAS